MKKYDEEIEEDDLSKDLSFIAHSLRTPLNTVIGECKLMLLEEGVTESLKEKGLLIGDAGRSLLVMINSLLDSLNEAAPSKEKGILLSQMREKLSEALLKSEGTVETPVDPDLSFDGAHALLVDDNPVNLTVIKGLLEEAGLSCDTALSGTEGMKMLDERKYDILLLDHMMPHPDGVETLSMIREKGNAIPSIALTANYVPGGEDYYLSKGFDAYVSKPVEGDGLVRAMKRLIPSFVSKKTAKAKEKTDTSLSKEYSFLYDVPGLDVKKGIGYCGGEKGYILAVKMFYETLPENHEAIKKAFLSEDFSLYTVKVHALKTSARMIGALSLSDLSLRLEEAGKGGDISFIKDNNEKLLNDYEAFQKELSRIEDNALGGEKKLPGKDVWPDAIKAIKELVPSMDYDSIEMILSDIGSYSLGSEEKALYDKLLKALRTFDWDLMEELINDNGGQ